jgi:hypothetical protein
VRVLGALGAAALLGMGCTPALDWREVRIEGSALTLLFPCKPVVQARTLDLAGAPARVALHVCDAGGRSWALLHADLGDPARVGPALQALAAGAAANVGAADAVPRPLRVAGATPNPHGGQLVLDGVAADGRRLRLTAALFAHGTQVFQASALGPALGPAQGGGRPGAAPASGAAAGAMPAARGHAGADAGADTGADADADADAQAFVASLRLGP